MVVSYRGMSDCVTVMPVLVRVVVPVVVMHFILQLEVFYSK